MAIHQVERHQVEPYPTTVAIYTTKRRPTVEQKTRKRAPVLIINQEDKSYGDMLKAIKEQLKDNTAS